MCCRTSGRCRAIIAIDAVRLDEAARLFEEAREFRRQSADTDFGDIDFMAAEADILEGRVEEGLAAMLRVAYDARGARRESTGVTAFRWAAHMAVRVMDYPTAEIGIGEGLKYADEIEQSYCRHVLAATSAHVAWTQGRWNDAIPTAEIELVERGSRRGTLGSRDALGYVAFGRGQVERARTLLEASLEIGRSSAEVDLIVPPMWGLAETALVAREPQVAIDWCEEALEVARATGEQALLVPFVVTGVRACQALVRPDAAEAWLERVRAQLEGWARAQRGPGARRGPAPPAGRLHRLRARPSRGGDRGLGRHRADLGGRRGRASTSRPASSGATGTRTPSRCCGRSRRSPTGSTARRSGAGATS